jgi:hypothetical protein
MRYIECPWCFSVSEHIQVTSSKPLWFIDRMHGDGLALRYLLASMRAWLTDVIRLFYRK